jgi:hypothetical protein
MNTLRLHLFILCAFICALSGCSSMERVINFPLQPAELKIESYNTSTHKINTNIFTPVDIHKKIESQKSGQKIDSINVIIDELQPPSHAIKQNILTQLLSSLPTQAPVIYIWSIGAKKETYAAPYHVQLTHENVLTPHLKFHEKFSDVAEKILEQEKPTAIVLIKDFLSYSTGDQDAIDSLRRKAHFLIQSSHPPKDKRLVASHENLCVYTIGPANKYPASVIDRADGCGHSITGGQLSHGRNASHFIEKMIYGTPQDTDGDGVPDYLDQCNDTPPATLVDANGCSEKIE